MLKVDPTTDEVTTMGDLKGEWCKSSIKRGRFKWLRGALDPTTGDMFGVPSNGNGSTATPTATAAPSLPFSAFMHA